MKFLRQRTRQREAQPPLTSREMERGNPPTLLVQHHLVASGRFGKGVANNTAGLLFSELAMKEQKSFIRILSNGIVVLLRGWIISYRRKNSL